MFFKAYMQKWVIGPTYRSDVQTVQIDTSEFCAEEFVNASWSERDAIYNPSKWIPVNAEIKCLDDDYP